MKLVVGRKRVLALLVSFSLGILSAVLSFSVASAESLSVSGRDTGFKIIDVVVDLPADYLTDPETGEFFTKAEIEAQVLTAFAGASTYFAPLGLSLNVKKINYLGVAQADPYAEAVFKSNPYDILKTGVGRWTEAELAKFDLRVVLTRSRLNGYAGLAYPGVSCVLPRYSVVFATQGGDSAFHRYTLQQTLAHEIGHYLGMEHDNESYPSGPSLMWNGFVRYASGFSVHSLRQAEHHLNEQGQGGACFARAVSGGNLRLVDRDADGFSEDEELAFGASELNNGSRPSTLKSPVYALWNSFLDTTNILEILNKDSVSQKVVVSLYAIDGSLAYRGKLELAPRAQFDVILNNLPGFQADSYGLVVIEYAGQIDGRTSYYRSSSPSGTYEFAFSVPFTNPSRGKTAVSFNTFQPSHNTLEAEHAVTNWLSIVNLEEAEQIFAVYSFDNEARVLAAKTVRVPGFGRIDLDGGHGFGSSRVGFHEVLPANPASAYIAQLIRYGGNTTANLAPSSYKFAFPLLSRAGSGQAVRVPISKTASTEENWLEVVNTQTSIVLAKLSYFGEDGELLRSEDLELLPHAGIHLNASDVLAKSAHRFGSVQILPNTENSLLIESMFYNREQATGSILSLHGISAVEASPKSLTGSYNLFLGMENWLLLANDSDERLELVLGIQSDDEFTSYPLSLPAQGSARIPLHDYSLFATSPDSYGSLDVRPLSDGGLRADLLRLRKTSRGIDFISPSSLR